jgi:hypothetical protein
MNQLVDYRADYYALGATFYELLAGQPPFAGADAMALVHCHIACTPNWSHPALERLPGALLAVLQRLMEKNAEQRYQSLRGLRADLENCRTAQPAGTAPGAADRNPRFLIAQKLHGREREIAALLAAFERAAAGSAELLLVAGYSGIGKSAVVNEVHKPIVARRGCFISGKFDQYRRDVPYASLIQAFQGLIRHLLSEPGEQLRQWSGKLHAALGDGLGVMVELIADLALVVGATEAPAPLAPEQARIRLGRLFPRFVAVFASAEHPLVLFLDDLQWADAPTLQMIELLMSGGRHSLMLLIGAYRDNEVQAAHPLTSCERLQQGGAAGDDSAHALSEQQAGRVSPIPCGGAGCVRAAGAPVPPQDGGNPFS